MKLKINDTHYTEKYHPIDCTGCTFEDLSMCQYIPLLGDMRIRGDRIYIKRGIIKVLDYENSISR